MSRPAWATAIALLALTVATQASGRGADAACPVAPISRDALNAAINRPAEPFVEPAPGGGPVDARRVRQIVDLVIDLDDCARTGEPLRVWSLYSPAYLARLFQVQGPFDEATYAAYAEPAPSDELGPAVQSFQRIWAAGGGFWGVEAIKTYPSVPTPKRLIFWIVETDQGLRIEEITGEVSFSLP